jgi:2-polyprenyl-3-methyl-5-hydroxy-6-metoxy-1,4-benzoquinol methylase
MGRFRYLGRCVARQINPARFQCPNCGNRRSELVARKYLVSQLRRCDRCRLLFRTPTDDPADNQRYYESEYAQGFTTDLPSDCQLHNLMATNFAGSEKDYSYYVHVLRNLGLASGTRLFDFGCSWGYGSYQLMRAGYDVTAFEIDRSRRAYARERLGVLLVDDMDKALSDPKHVGRYDCFFSSHVLEHVPSVAAVFTFARALVIENGIFLSFTPNGSAAFRHRQPSAWNYLWGEVHPNFIDDVFLDYQFRTAPRAIGSSPMHHTAFPNDASANVANDLDAGELTFAARLTTQWRDWQDSLTPSIQG